MADELDRIQRILDENASKNFVQRILRPAEFPYLELDNGYRATHLMAAEIDDETGKWLVFPTILQDGEELKNYGMEGVRKAMAEAKKRGEFIDFGDDKDGAISFSQNYKQIWPEGMR